MDREIASPGVRRRQSEHLSMDISVSTLIESHFGNRTSRTLGLHVPSMSPSVTGFDLSVDESVWRDGRR